MIPTTLDGSPRESNLDILGRIVIDRLFRLAEITAQGCLALLVLSLPLWLHWLIFTQLPDPLLYDWHERVVYATDPLLWLVLGAWLASRLLDRQNTPIRWGPAFLSVPLLGLLLLSLLSIRQAVDPLWAAYTAERLALAVVLYFAVLNLRVRPGLVAWPLLAGLALQGAVGIPQYWLGHGLGLKRLGETVVSAAVRGASVVMVGELRYLRAYGLASHPNVLGGLLAAGLMVCAGYLLVQKGWRRILLLLLFGVGLATLLVTFSRSAWLGALAGAIVAGALLVWREGWKALKVRRTSLFLLAGLSLMVVLAFVALNWPLLRPRLGLADQWTETRSLDERAVRSAAALALIRMHPWTGTGAGNFSVALAKYAPESVAPYSYFDPVHNVLLLVTAELGPAGGILWLYLILLPWVALWVRRRKIRLSPWRAGLAGALVVLTVVSLTDNYVWSTQQGRLLLVLVLGLWAREWSVGGRGEPDSSGQPAVFAR